MGRPYIPIPEKVVKECLKAYQEGLTQKEIRDKFSVDDKKLRRALLENGITKEQLKKRGNKATAQIKIKNNELSQTKIEEILKNFEDGSSQKEIAEKHEITTEKARKTLIANGITEAQLEERHREINRKNSAKSARWKVGDTNFHMTIKRIFRSEVIKNTGERETVTKAIVQCECGSEPKEIYLANFTRTKSCSTSCWHTFHRHANAEDLTNRWFGFLWVIKEGPKEVVGLAEAKRSTWFVYCQSCNTYPKDPIRGTSLTSGNTTRCPRCRTSKKEEFELINLSNQRFGKLRVLRRWGTRVRPKSKDSEAMWLCKCDGCGSTISYQQNNLRSGNSRQCNECAGQFNDNLDKFLLDKDFANTQCFYYIANVENKFLKPGIAESLIQRTRSSKGKYLTYHFESEAMTRGEAWTIEQLVLDASYSARPKYLDSSYAEWGGVSELRDPKLISLDQLKALTKMAMDEVSRNGWKKIWYSNFKLKTTNQR